jgi:hypothetical protein
LAKVHADILNWKNLYNCDLHHIPRRAFRAQSSVDGLFIRSSPFPQEHQLGPALPAPFFSRFFPPNFTPLFDPCPKWWFGEQSLVSGGRAVYKARTLLVFSGETAMLGRKVDAWAFALLTDVTLLFINAQ